MENFQQTANYAMLDLTGDTDKALRQGHRAKMVWDKKKKRMVGVNTNSKVGKIKSESGTWIPATYKSGRYKAWVERNKMGDDNDSGSDNEGGSMKGLFWYNEYKYSLKLSDRIPHARVNIIPLQYNLG